MKVTIKDVAREAKMVTFIVSRVLANSSKISEPIEFLFMFISPVLYVIYAILTGLASALADIINLRVHAFGAIELITRVPMMINDGLLGDVISFVIACLAFFGINFGVFSFCIKKFKIPTPGRLGNYDEEESGDSKKEATVDKATANDVLSLKIISLLGEKENIEDVDACMTRLRVTVKDIEKVADGKRLEEKWSTRTNIKG